MLSDQFGTAMGANPASRGRSPAAWARSAVRASSPAVQRQRMDVRHCQRRRLHGQRRGVLHIDRRAHDRAGFTSGSFTFAGNASLTSSHLRDQQRLQRRRRLVQYQAQHDFLRHRFRLPDRLLGGSSVGGDGITFAIQNKANNAVGASQTGLGYGGIASSVAPEVRSRSLGQRELAE